MPCIPAVPNGSSLDVVGELTESGEGHAHSQHEVFVGSNYSLAKNQKLPGKFPHAVYNKNIVLVRKSMCTLPICEDSDHGTKIYTQWN